MIHHSPLSRAAANQLARMQERQDADFSNVLRKLPWYLRPFRGIVRDIWEHDFACGGNYEMDCREGKQ